MRSALRSTAITVLVATAAIACGCTHAAEFKRIEKPRPTHGAPGRVTAKVAVTTDGSVGTAGLEEVICAAGASIVQAKDADYVVRLSRTSRGASSGWNLPICWPGFLVFAPSWNGLVWRYDVATQARIRHSTGRDLPLVKADASYDTRYTSDMQGIAIGSGWFLFYSAPALLAGVATSIMDPDLDSLDRAFPEAERRDIGREIGEAVVREIASDAAAARGRGGPG